jgi:hypothetical protein
MLSTALSQALIALRAYSKVAAGWAVALVVFGVGVWVGDELLPRVELGLVAGSMMSVLAMGALLKVQMRSGPIPATAEPLYQAISPEHEIIEP